MSNNVIPFPQAADDEIIYRRFGVGRERMTSYQQTAIALEALDLGFSYEELLCSYWAFGGI
jgi:hypothetical protein